jgi:hypothetical protein
LEGFGLFGVERLERIFILGFEFEGWNFSTLELDLVVVLSLERDDFFKFFHETVAGDGENVFARVDEEFEVAGAWDLFLEDSG